MIAKACINSEQQRKKEYKTEILIAYLHETIQINNYMVHCLSIYVSMLIIPSTYVPRPFGTWKIMSLQNFLSVVAPSFSRFAKSPDPGSVIHSNIFVR